MENITAKEQVNQEDFSTESMMSAEEITQVEEEVFQDIEQELVQEQSENEKEVSVVHADEVSQLKERLKELRQETSVTPRKGSIEMKTKARPITWHPNLYKGELEKMKQIIRREIKIWINPHAVLIEENFAETAVHARALEKTKDIANPEQRKERYVEVKEDLLLGLNYEGIKKSVFDDHFDKYYSYARKGELWYLSILRFCYTVSSDIGADNLCSRPKGDIYKKYLNVLIDKAHAELIRAVIQLAKENPAPLRKFILNKGTVEAMIGQEKTEQLMPEKKRVSVSESGLSLNSQENIGEAVK